MMHKTTVFIINTVSEDFVIACFQIHVHYDPDIADDE